MLWYFFAVSSAIIAPVVALFSSRIVRQADAITYAFLSNLLGMLLFAPFAVATWRSASINAWFSATAAGILWAAGAVLIMLSYKHTENSVRASLGETRTVWIVLLGVVLLHEAFTLSKLAGVFAICVATFLVTYRQGIRASSFATPGVKYTLLAALVIAVATIADKRALSSFAPLQYAFIVSAVPAVLLGAYVLAKRSAHLHPLITRNVRTLVLINLLGSLDFYCRYRAYSLEDVSHVYPVLRLSILITVLLSIIFLGERQNVLRKLLGGVLAVLGVLLISGAV